MRESRYAAESVAGVAPQGTVTAEGRLRHTYTAPRNRPPRSRHRRLTLRQQPHT